MDILKNRVDFCGVIVAERCNPNGDPVNFGMPRHDLDGYGIISSVCIKRKIRDWLFANGQDIFVRQQEFLPEGIKSLRELSQSVESMEDAKKKGDSALYKKIACQKWLDVRAFGQVFPFKGKGGGVAEAIRGPVSIQDATSLDIVDIMDFQITKSVNTIPAKSDSEKSSDTMGCKYRIDHGAYVFRGSMHPQLAAMTGFSDNDALLIRDAILNMFCGDASAARPSGSLSLDKLFWWEHNCPNGQYSPAKVFRSLQFSPSDTYPYYFVTVNNLDGLCPDIFDGF